MEDQIAIATLLRKLNEAQRVAQVGSWDWDIATGEVWWSDETYRLFGVSPAEFTPGFENNAQLVHPDDLQRYRDSFAHALATGDPVNLEVRLCAADGKNKVCLARGEIVCDAEGSPARVVGTVQDITERKQIEAERDRLLAAIEQAGEIIGVATPDATVRYVNSAFRTITAIDCDEVVGRNLKDFDLKIVSGDSVKTIWERVSGGARWSGRVQVGGNERKVRALDVTVSPVCDATGQVVDIVAVARDVTLQVELEQQLLAAQKMEAVGRLAGGVAHDFNNLLSVIINCNDFALHDLPAGSPLRSDLLDVKRAAERAADLTKQLLAFSRKQILEPVVLDLNLVVLDLESMLRRLLGEAIELELRCSRILDPIKADAGQLQQVIMNLIVNARDAMQGSGRLTIETNNVELGNDYPEGHAEAIPGHYVMLAVSDTGCGLDPITKQHLFEPFYTTKQMGYGTGLGLATVYGIIKQSGGRILVYSEEGHGTTFKIYLPRCLDPVDFNTTRAELTQPIAGSETILLVEDETAVRSVIERMLVQAGYRVLCAGNGAEALCLAGEFAGEIQLLLTDVVLPQMSGRQLAERIAHPRSGIRVLFMSGYTDDAIVHHGVLDPDTQFISKPFSATTLARKVRDVLS